jgi:cell cycle checkpoint protein
MKLASKVSVRGDEQGVLSLQFMVEVEEKKVSFVDFRLVPFVPNDDEDGEEDEEGDDEEEYEEGDDQ